MLITVAFIIFVAWASVVLVAASHHGRTVGRFHRVAVAIGVLGVVLVMPALFIGSFGLPASWSYRWKKKKGHSSFSWGQNKR